MRFISGVIGAAVIAASVVTASSSTVQADEVVAPAAQPVDVATAAVPPVDEGAAPATLSEDGAEADVVAELPARSTDDFGLVGVTWDPGFDAAGLMVEVRLRADGAWGTWQELHSEGAEEQAGTPGTEPLWVGSADGVSVRVASPTGQRPPGLKVATIDPGATPAAASASTVSPALHRTSSSTGMTTVAAASKPAIISRAAWGAAKNTPCDSPTVVSETRGAVVHHTAGTNTYTKAESASIVRATQAYHMKSRNWCDIGYNFLVDKYGQVFEGRNGGVDKQVRAAHSGNAAVNTYTVGVSMMGTFSTSAPTNATKDAVARLISWRLGISGTPTTGTYSLGGKTLHRIAGHRDVVGTECPGAAAYAWLSASGGLRQKVAAGGGSAAPQTEIAKRAAQLGAGATGAVVKAEYRFGSAPGGTKARYAKIDIISSPRGTFSLSDVIRSRYNKLSAQSGVLGVPTGAVRTTKRSLVRIQRFEDGTIYRVKRSGRPSGFALWGDVEDKYRRLGEADSALGAPTKTQTRLSGGVQRAYFKKGYITLHSNGRVSVKTR
jgi:uncharacterized protein with LGFP repeats